MRSLSFARLSIVCWSGVQALNDPLWVSVFQYFSISVFRYCWLFVDLVFKLRLTLPHFEKFAFSTGYLFNGSNQILFIDRQPGVQAKIDPPPLWVSLNWQCDRLLRHVTCVGKVVSRAYQCLEHLHNLRNPNWSNLHNSEPGRPGP